MGLKNGKAQNGFWQRRRALYEVLKARVQSLTELFIVEHIWDACTGGPRPIPWLQLTDDELTAIARGVSRQAVHTAVTRMMSPGLGWISRRPAANDRRSWEYTVHPENFARGPVWAARTCSPRAGSVNSTLRKLQERFTEAQTGSVNSALQKLQAECAYAHECPYLLNKLNTNTSSSSLGERATTTEGANASAPDAAPVVPPQPEPRIENPAPNRGDTPRASVRPRDGAERKRALPRPHQRAANNGGDRRHGGPGPSDPAGRNEQNTAVLFDPALVEVAAAIEACTGLRPDDAFLRDFYRMWQAAAPGASAARVVAVIHAKARGSLRADNPVAHLRTCVLNELTKPEPRPPAPREQIVWLTQDELAKRDGGT